MLRRSRTTCKRSFSCDKPLLTHFRSITIERHVTDAILERCKTLAPELLTSDGEFEIVREQVGFRPTRIGGARVELERLDEGKFVCHNYGHHGAG